MLSRSATDQQVKVGTTTHMPPEILSGKMRKATEALDIYRSVNEMQNIYKSKQINPNTFAGLVGKVQKKTISSRRKEGRGRKKARAARPLDPGLEPGTCGVVGEGPQLHARGAV